MRLCGANRHLSRREPGWYSRRKWLLEFRAEAPPLLETIVKSWPDKRSKMNHVSVNIGLIIKAEAVPIFESLLTKIEQQSTLADCERCRFYLFRTEHLRIIIYRTMASELRYSRSFNKRLARWPDLVEPLHSTRPKCEASLRTIP